MKILVVNPNTSSAMTEAIARAARQAARAGTEVDCVSPDFGSRLIEGHAEEATAAAATLEAIARECDRDEAFVIACFGDPGLAASRELADVPVIGIAEAAMHLSCLVAHRFSIVSVLPRVKPMLLDRPAVPAGQSLRIDPHYGPGCP